jgi:hypothetical protein
MDTSSPAGEAAAGAGVGVLKTEEQKNAESAGLFMERLEDSMKKKGDLWLRDEEEEDKVWARDPACVRGLRSASAGVAGLLGGWSLSTQFSLRWRPTGSDAVQIRLGEEGWKTRYYSVKMEWAVDGDMEAKRREMVYKYVEGLCWVLKYYFEGCQSWGWYYPYHYAPFASDFKVRMQVALVGNARRGTY